MECLHGHTLSSLPVVADIEVMIEAMQEYPDILIQEANHGVGLGKIIERLVDSICDTRALLRDIVRRLENDGDRDLFSPASATETISFGELL